MGLQIDIAPYHDDAEAADAVSMHTTRDDYTYDNGPELPSYSDSEAAASASRDTIQPTRSADHQMSSHDPYTTVQPLRNTQYRSGNLVNRGETTIRLHARLADPGELEKYMKNYVAVVPPNQCIRISGYHDEMQYSHSSKKNQKTTVTDFDITFSLSSFLTRDCSFWDTFTADNSDSVYRGSFRKTRAKGYRQDIEIAERENPTLQDWCRVYCSDKSTLKVFRVTRTVEGLETDFIRNALERVVRSTHYHGRLNISFPIEEKHIDIYNDNLINRWRLGWQRWIFYLTFLWIIIWPVLFFATKWWSVYNVRWMFSRCQTDEEQQRSYKVYASITEKEWLDQHKNLVMALVLEKYQGDASQFPTEVPDDRVARGVQTRLPNTGNRNVDAAVSILQGSVNAYNALQGRNPDVWGADTA